jgi:hypothetical protein
VPQSWTHESKLLKIKFGGAFLWLWKRVIEESWMIKFALRAVSLVAVKHSSLCFFYYVEPVPAFVVFAFSDQICMLLSLKSAEFVLCIVDETSIFSWSSNGCFL